MSKKKFDLKPSTNLPALLMYTWARQAKTQGARQAQHETRMMPIYCK